MPTYRGGIPRKTIYETGADSADRTRPNNVPRPQSKWRFMGESYPAAFHGQPEISAKNEMVSAGLGFRAAGEPLPNKQKIA